MVQKIGTQKASKEMDPHPTGILLPAIEADFLRRREDPQDRLGPYETSGTRLRASYSLTCARQMGFQILGVPEDTEVPAEILVAFDVGHMYHELIQGIAEREFKAESEVVGIYPPDVEMSTHADFVYIQSLYNPGFDDVPAKVAAEIKSISGYGFMIAVGKRKSDDLPGPKTEHICQVTMSAMAPNIDAKYIHLIYLDKDKNSIAEWRFDIDEPLEKLEGLSPRELAIAELERMHGVLGRLDSGMLPARHIPGHGRINVVPDPDGRGQPWNCRYCRWNPTCAAMPAGPVDLVEVGLGEYVNETAQNAAHATSGNPA